MTKLERSRCEKRKEEGNAVEAEISLRDFEFLKGYAEGIHQALTVVGYNSEDFIKFDEVLQQ